VQSHLRRIYARLGVANRTELGAEAARHGGGRSEGHART
jgi:DNA-binding CsgD family transcriptional regulator